MGSMSVGVCLCLAKFMRRMMKRQQLRKAVIFRVGPESVVGCFEFEQNQCDPFEVHEAVALFLKLSIGQFEELLPKACRSLSVLKLLLFVVENHG
jgi:hypothetical protein